MDNRASIGGDKLLVYESRAIKMKEFIKQEAEHFFEWYDTEKKEYVTYTSCLLFAEYIAKKIEQKEHQK